MASHLEGVEMSGLRRLESMLTESISRNRIALVNAVTPGASLEQILYSKGFIEGQEAILGNIRVEMEERNSHGRSNEARVE